MLTLLAKALFRVFALTLLLSAVVSAQARGVIGSGREPSAGSNPPASGAKPLSRAGIDR